MTLIGTTTTKLGKRKYQLSINLHGLNGT